MMKLAVSILSVCILVAALMTLPMWSEAQPGGGGNGGGRNDDGGNDGRRPPHGPPPEAIAACEGKSEGDSCEFTSPRDETIGGICRNIEEQLACAPKGGPHGGRPKDDDSEDKAGRGKN